MSITQEQLKDSLIKLNKLPLIDDTNLNETFEKITEKIQRNDEIENLFGSDHLSHAYFLVGTDRRVLVMDKSLLGKGHDFELSYRNIKTIVAKKGIFSPKIIINTKDGRIYRFRDRSFFCSGTLSYL